MQEGVDITCMHTNFDGWSLSSFGDKISLWSIKVEKFNQSKSAKKIMQVAPVLVDVTSPVSEIRLPFKNGQISLPGHGL